MFALSIIAGLSLTVQTQGAGRAPARRDLPDTPANHWIYAAMKEMRATGILVDYPDGFSVPRREANTPYTMAVAVNAACFRLHSLAGDPGQPELRPLVEFEPEKLERLIRFFSPELQSLGVEVERLQSQLRRDVDAIYTLSPTNPTEKQFSDVPKGHLGRLPPS